MRAATIHVNGLEDVLNALDNEIIAVPARNLLERAGASTQRSARKKAPVDRGGLRDSITYRVDEAYMPRFVEVGSNLKYARAIELGRPEGKMPPVAALEAWARRHPKEGGYEQGDGWALAIHILNNGTKPQPYLVPAVEELKPKVPRLLATMAREIEKMAAARGGGG